MVLTLQLVSLTNKTPSYHLYNFSWQIVIFFFYVNFTINYTLIWFLILLTYWKINFYQGASLKAAESLGIAHAQLPINKYINMQTRKILTVNQGNLIYFVMKYSRTVFLKLFSVELQGFTLFKSGKKLSTKLRCFFFIFLKKLLSIVTASGEKNVCIVEKKMFDMRNVHTSLTFWGQVVISKKDTNSYFFKLRDEVCVFF